MLTSVRAKKGVGPEQTVCPCKQGQDTELRQYWEYGRWSSSRSQVEELRMDELPKITRCTGIILANSPLTMQQARRLQQHVIRVAMFVARDKERENSDRQQE